MKPDFPSRSANELYTAGTNRSSVYVLLLAMVAFGSMNSVLFSLFPLFGTELNMSATEITSIGTFAALGIFLCSPFWGRKSDSWGRKNTITFGMAGYACMATLLVAVLLAGLSGTLTGVELYSSLLASRVVQALLLAAMLPAATAYMIDVTTPEQRTVGLSRIAASHGIGSIAGPMLVSLSAFGLLVPLYVALSLAAAMALVVWVFLREPQHNFKRPDANRKMSYFDPRYRLILAVGVVVYIAMAVSTQTMGFYLPHVLQLETLDAAKPLAITQGSSAVAMVFVQLVLIQRLQWPPLKYVFTGVPLVMAGFACLLLADKLALFVIASVLIGLGLGLAGPGYSAAVSLTVKPEEQGAVSGLISACPALGFVIGPLSAGVLYDIDPILPYAVALGVLTLIYPLVISLFRSSGLPKK
jgi:MFS family permease